MANDDDIIQGAAAIAEAYWGDKRHARRIYGGNLHGLPLFHHRGRVCAFQGALDAHKAAIRTQKQALRAMMEKTAAETPVFAAAVQQQEV
jgi:hypothetical protein